MNIKEELFKSVALEILSDEISNIKIDVGNIEDTQAIKILGEIQDILHNKYNEDDFIIVEEIVRVFEKYHISAGPCHDF
ncbi:MAG: hypothetical protein E7415_04475 [Ruminococcaceae bacterium]|nr:hypothetical protein [Oscillospiraceae bacterium]